MTIELVSILILTFSLTLIVLGLITLWLERRPGRWQGVVTALVGLFVGAAYAFLGSRFSITLFGRLIVQVDLPALMLTAITYTVGVVGGALIALALFLWVTGRYRAWEIRRRVLATVLLTVLVTILLTFLAVWLSRAPG
ncbi:MAG TPA: hypothetical protein EYH27_07590 [Anaerolineales bacterium]|nr:hypothetical protein [Anaerolineae bacterium]HIP88275.1 hypothetical protein [Anaerolineales bacterium]